MTTSLPAMRPLGGRREILALQILVAAFLALRLYITLNADLLGDEAYYWMWGQHLSWSYFDHPPLHAWLLRCVDMILGWHNVNVRLLTWVTLAVVLAIFWRWAKRLAPEDPQTWFWRGAAIYLATPMFFALTTVAYHDHLVVALMMVAGHCFVLFVERYESSRSDWRRWLLGAAAGVGLAALAKYSAVFLALGFAATFLRRPGLRPLLRTPWPWLAGLLALALQAPVLWWNFIEGGASFAYHFNERWNGDVGGFHWEHLLVFVAQTLLFGSPFLVWPIIRLLRGEAGGGFSSAAKTLAVSTFTISTVALLLVSLFMNAYFYWNIPGLAVLMLLLPGAMQNPWLRAGHLAYGLLWAVIVTVNYTTIPIGTLLHRQDNGASINYDWSRIAAHVKAARQPGDLIAATHYSTASQLGFELGVSDVLKLSPAPSQYDYWQDLARLDNRAVVILVDLEDQRQLVDYLKQHFVTLTEVDDFTIRRFGRYLYEWRILRGEGYRP